MLEGFEGDFGGTVAGLVEGEGDDQGGDDVGVGRAVGQRCAVVVGVAGYDEAGVVAVQALLDPLLCWCVCHEGVAAGVRVSGGVRQGAEPVTGLLRRAGLGGP